MAIPGRAENSMTLTLDSRLEDVFLAGLAVRGICLYTPLDPCAACQVELCVVEAVTNAVKHAYGEKAGNEVRIVVSLGPDRITISVGDKGSPMGNIARPEPVGDRDHLENLPESGFGLFIIRSVMDLVSYGREEGGWNVLNMMKRFPAEP